MKKIFFIILVLLALKIHAKEEFPDGCYPFLLDAKKALITNDKPVLVMLHNLTKGDLWITHPVAEAGASAGWTINIQKNNWAALSLADASFELICIESQPGHEQQIPCKEALSVCKWKKTLIPEEQQKATFWAGEDMQLSELIAYLGRRGFVLSTTE